MQIESIESPGVYLDFAAATPVAREVLEAMNPYWSTRFYNPSAPYSVAREVRHDVDSARARLARTIGARPGNITLTAGATEANNLAFMAVGGRALVCGTDHDSVLACAATHEMKTIRVAKDGTVDMADLKSKLSSDIEIVSIGLANGEVGTIQPLREASIVVRDERMRRLEANIATPLLLHTDASQAAGHVSVNVSSLGVDLMTLSAAKVYGPKQVGLLWHADGIALHPLVRGGGQEGGLRSGTENVAGAVGFACALELSEGMRAGEAKRLQLLSTMLRKRLMEGIPDVVFAGPSRANRRLPGIVHASFVGVDARRLVISLERRGVYVGTGSACAASRMQSSHVLESMGYSRELAQGSIRVSMGRTTTEEQVAYAASAIVECVLAERARIGWKR